MAGRKRSALGGTGLSAELARRLRALRDGSGLTLRQLAAKSGFSHSALSLAESGRVVPSWELVQAFVQACGDSPRAWRQLWEIARAESEPAEAPPVVSSGSPAAAPQGSPAATETLATVGLATASAGPPAGEPPVAASAVPAPHRRRPPGPVLVAAVAAVVVAVSAVTAWAVTAGRATNAGTGVAAAPLPSPAPAKDGTDPYDDGCKADHKQLDWQPVTRKDGSAFGTILLMYSPACRAAWGYLQGPNRASWTTHIVAHRMPGDVSAPSQFNGDADPGSWGNVLSTNPGCVFVEAYVVDGAGEGPHARTACIQP
ncbi:transcriptional regulator [Microbispora sp. NBRC 16548]|uniref:helix-turn-helix domain-containing protein n=1 Tax=Microbispora sp. NBRC 16548 TaxID=3030994 RepID=UPI0016071FAC|nr:transcriptional regulator [Microbispora sp. NBRC 16548]GLX05281.1 hypothetical protein Misp03_22080 [Microbispora sp. NBRC 16548]